MEAPLSLRLQLVPAPGPRVIRRVRHVGPLLGVTLAGELTKVLCSQSSFQALEHTAHIYDASCIYDTFMHHFIISNRI